VVTTVNLSPTKAFVAKLLATKSTASKHGTFKIQYDAHIQPQYTL